MILDSPVRIFNPHYPEMALMNLFELNVKTFALDKKQTYLFPYDTYEDYDGLYFQCISIYEGCEDRCVMSLYNLTRHYTYTSNYELEKMLRLTFL